MIVTLRRSNRLKVLEGLDNEEINPHQCLLSKVGKYYQPEEVASTHTTERKARSISQTPDEDQKAVESEPPNQEQRLSYSNCQGYFKTSDTLRRHKNRGMCLTRLRTNLGSSITKKALQPVHNARTDCEQWFRSKNLFSQHKNNCYVKQQKNPTDDGHEALKDPRKTKITEKASECPKCLTIIHSKTFLDRHINQGE